MQSQTAALGSLSSLFEVYSECLDMSRRFVEEQSGEMSQVSEEAWESFLEGRERLFDAAEADLFAITRPEAKSTINLSDAELKPLKDQVMSVLREMEEMEVALKNFLNESIIQIDETIKTIQKTQPVLKHYGQFAKNDQPQHLDSMG